MRILVTGGAGYIGGHTCVVLAERGHQIVIADNFSNSSPLVLQRLSRLTHKVIASHRLDLRDRDACRRCWTTYRFDAVMHFAASQGGGRVVRAAAGLLRQQRRRQHRRCCRL